VWANDDQADTELYLDYRTNFIAPGISDAGERWELTSERSPDVYPWCHNKQIADDDVESECCIQEMRFDDTREANQYQFDSPRSLLLTATLSGDSCPGGAGYFDDAGDVNVLVDDVLVDGTTVGTLIAYYIWPNTRGPSSDFILSADATTIEASGAVYKIERPFCSTGFVTSTKLRDDGDFRLTSPTGPESGTIETTTRRHTPRKAYPNMLVFGDSENGNGWSMVMSFMSPFGYSDIIGARVHLKEMPGKDFGETPFGWCNQKPCLQVATSTTDGFRFTPGLEKQDVKTWLHVKDQDAQDGDVMFEHPYWYIPIDHTALNQDDKLSQVLVRFLGGGTSQSRNGDRDRTRFEMFGDDGATLEVCRF
jgi:hypothetical protein